MGIGTTVQTAVQAAFDVLDDMLTVVTYRAKSSGSATYNTTTGAVSESYTDYSVSGLLVRYQAKEIDNLAIQPTDQKLLIPVLDLSPTPKLNDVVVISSVSWQVVNFGKDPASAMWVIQLRLP